MLQGECLSRNREPFFSLILYGAHIWAWDFIHDLEKVQNQFLKRIFRLEFNTPAYLLHSEFGILPAKYHLFKRTFKWWMRIKESEKQNINTHLWDY